MKPASSGATEGEDKFKILQFILVKQLVDPACGLSVANRSWGIIYPAAV